MGNLIQTIGLDFVNAFLVKAGEGFILVDCGLPMHWGRLRDALEKAGCSPGRLKLVILTHGDPDHAGNCTRLREEFKAPIAAHRAELPALQTGERPARTVRGTSKKLLYSIITAMRRLRRHGRAMPGFTPEVLLEDGQSLAQYGLDARVVHLPGHTPGSIGILTADGALIAGDSVANRRYPAPSPYIEDIVSYRATIDRLKGLATMSSVVYPGHGTPFPAAGLARLEL